MTNAHLHYEALPPRVWRDGDDLHIIDTGGSEVVLTGSYDVLAEWYRAQDDERTGRTRIAAHPDLVAYAGEDDWATVIDERTGTSEQVSRYAVLAGSDDPERLAVLQVARANLEPRTPAWWFAEVGQLWEVQWSEDGPDHKPTTFTAFVVARDQAREHPAFAFTNTQIVVVDAVGIVGATLIGHVDDLEV